MANLHKIATAPTKEQAMRVIRELYGCKEPVKPKPDKAVKNNG